MAGNSLFDPGNSPLSSSEATTIPELIETFEALGDWEAQCDYLIDLGYEIPEFPASARIEASARPSLLCAVRWFASIATSSNPSIA